MKRFTGFLSKRGGTSNGAQADGDTPEANVARGVRLFCESGGPNNSGEEVLHLPVIVDAAESSPAAAKEAAYGIRKFLGKENFQRAYVQYNAIMLMRILADNPGKTFTKNIDSKFIATTKELLRDGRDMSVQQILRETLDTFQAGKSQDETLAPLIKMWESEKLKWGLNSGGPPIPRNLNAPPFDPNPQQQNYFARNHDRHGLPTPHELASRIEEAKTSAKLLLQVVQSTSPAEISSNELIKEFAERCSSASKSIQSYIHADNPAPDEDTMLTLIETNEQLSQAMSKHQRAVLNARRQTNQSNLTKSPPPQPPRDTSLGGIAPEPSLMSENNSSANPTGPPPRLGMPNIPSRQENDENPFDDRHHSALDTKDQSSPAPLQPQEDLSSYHPGFKPTPSYLHRQESSTNTVTMTGAKIEEEVESPAPGPRYRF